MHFSTTTVAFAAFLAFVYADLHTNAICVNDVQGYAVYNEQATKDACAAYLARNTGSKQWESCPDCTFVTDSPAHCHSDGWHMGGNEINAYCQATGTGAVAAVL